MGSRNNKGVILGKKNVGDEIKVREYMDRMNDML